MIVFEFDGDDGVAVPDNRAEAYILDAIAAGQRHLVLGTSVMLNVPRLLLRRGQLRVADCQFIFKGQVLVHQADGRFAEWPEGFADVMDKQLMEIV